MKNNKYVNLALALITFLVMGLFETYASSDLEHHTDNVPSNTFCPVFPDEPIDPEISVLHEGVRIFLCCNKCRRKFIANPSKYLSSSDSPDHGGDLGEEHDHERDHASEAEKNKLRSFIGKFHPLAVHFPIALLLTALLAEVLALCRSSLLWANIARFLVVLGSASAVAAAGLGWLTAEGASYPGEMSDILWRHRWLGVSVSIVSVISAVLACVHRTRKSWLWAYRFFLAVTAVLVGITAHFGASLIYGLEYFKW